MSLNEWAECDLDCLNLFQIGFWQVLISKGVVFWLRYGYIIFICDSVMGYGTDSDLKWLGKWSNFCDDLMFDEKAHEYIVVTDNSSYISRFEQFSGPKDTYLSPNHPQISEILSIIRNTTLNLVQKCMHMNDHWTWFFFFHEHSTIHLS